MDEAAKERFSTVPRQKLWEETSYPTGMWGTGAVDDDQAEHVRVFRTGDLGRISRNGLELAGRLDLQAKIGGALALQPAHHACKLMVEDVSAERMRRSQRLVHLLVRWHIEVCKDPSMMCGVQV